MCKVTGIQIGDYRLILHVAASAYVELLVRRQSKSLIYTDTMDTKHSVFVIYPMTVFQGASEIIIYLVLLLPLSCPIFASLIYED